MPFSRETRESVQHRARIIDRIIKETGATPNAAAEILRKNMGLLSQKNFGQWRKLRTGRR